MDNDLKVKENFQRRAAKRLGLFLKKSSAKKWGIGNRGGYEIVIPVPRTLLFGRGYSLTLNEAGLILSEIEKRLKVKPELSAEDLTEIDNILGRTEKRIPALTQTELVDIALNRAREESKPHD